jgi:hypothetical protein
VLGSRSILGGDVLAIPTGLSQERKEQAIRLIEQLVAKETQRTLAETLYWAPVREDVYAELTAYPGQRQEQFTLIRARLTTAVMRPITPHWGAVQAALSEALQKVLEQGRDHRTPATEAQIDALLRPYADRLQAIPFDTSPETVNVGSSCLAPERRQAESGRLSAYRSNLTGTER